MKMNMINKYNSLTLLLAISVCFIMTSCSGDDNKDKNEKAVSLTQTTDGYYTDDVLLFDIESSLTHEAKVIGVQANDVANIVIPKYVIIKGNKYSVTIIAEEAFYGCEWMVNITIPETIRRIEAYAFSSCSNLENVYIKDLAAWCNIIFGSVSEEPFDIWIDFSRFNANPLYYAKHLYVNNKEVTNLVVPNSVINIEPYTFCYLPSLTSVTIPQNVKTIGSAAFFGDDNISTVSFTNGLEIIGQDAFKHCYGLTEIIIPNTVTYIGISVFEDCTGLERVTFPNSLTKTGARVFLGCNSLTDVTALRADPSAYNMGGGFFSDCSTIGTTCVLHVPTGCREIYSYTYPWDKFSIILEDAH